MFAGDFLLSIGCSESHSCTLDGTSHYTVCCCDTPYCNDEAFVKKCKARIPPKPKPITCRSSDGASVNCTGKHSKINSNYS